MFLEFTGPLFVDVVPDVDVGGEFPGIRVRLLNPGWYLVPSVMRPVHIPGQRSVFYAHFVYHTFARVPVKLTIGECNRADGFFHLCRRAAMTPVLVRVRVCRRVYPRCGQPRGGAAGWTRRPWCPVSNPDLTDASAPLHGPVGILVA